MGDASTIIDGLGWLYFIRDTYPISFISIILCTFGYVMTSIGFRHHLKTLRATKKEILQRILENLH